MNNNTFIRLKNIMKKALGGGAKHPKLPDYATGYY